MQSSNELKTSRLILRPISDKYLEDFNSLIRNEEIIRFSSDISFVIHDKSFILLGIILKAGEFFLGCCGLKFIHQKDNYECFFALFPQYWGNGYAVESMKRLFDYAFDELEVKKLLIFIHPHNTRAWKVAERSGMKYMGQYKVKGKESYQMYFVIEKRDYITQRFY